MARASKASVTTSDTGIALDFASGESLTVDLASIPEDIIRKLTLHGLKQKVCDSYAGAEAAEAHEIAKGVVDNLLAGNWTAGREGGGGAARSSMLVEALAAATGKEQEEAIEVVKNLSDEQKKALRKHHAVAKELARIQAERAAEKAAKAAKEAEGKSADLGDLFGG